MKEKKFTIVEKIYRNKATNIKDGNMNVVKTKCKEVDLILFQHLSINESFTHSTSLSISYTLMNSFIALV